MYKKPGQVINGKEELPGTEGIKFFILGPPYDEDLSNEYLSNYTPLPTFTSKINNKSTTHD